MNRASYALALTPLLALACSTPPAPPDGSDASTDAVSRDVPADRMLVRPPPIERTQTESVLAPRRRACAFRAGAWPAETLGNDVPIGDDMPIQHILVLMQENRSFDHYFSRLPAAGQSDVEVAPDDWTNPRADGTPVPRAHDTTYCFEDVAHGWNPVHRQYNDGRMDGFVVTNEPMGERAMSYLDQSDLPFYYSLATTFAIGDHYYCSLLGPTVPNRLFLMSGTSFGYAENTLAPDTQQMPADHVFRRMDAAGVEWRDYAAGLRMVQYYPYYGLFRRETRANLVTYDRLMDDLRTGNLPQVGFIEPAYTGSAADRTDEHPPAMPQAGERWVESIVRALMASPAWPRTALFILYDEHGGFADHVPPPEACPPDDRPTVDSNGNPLPGRFDRYGIRVPFIVVSPYAKRHFVSHNTYDHTSVLRFIEARFGLPAMTARDANASIPVDMFDFANPPFMTPPMLASSNPPGKADERCRMQYPSTGGL